MVIWGNLGCENNVIENILKIPGLELFKACHLIISIETLSIVAKNKRENVKGIEIIAHLIAYYLVVQDYRGENAFPISKK